MAATAASTAAKVCVLLALFAGLSSAQAQDTPKENQDIRRRVSDVAMALTAGNPAEAMEPFDKSFNDYAKLRDYFSALTAAYDLGSEVEVVDEQDTGNEVKLTARWTLTLTEQQTHSARNRTAEISMRLVRKNGKWKILEFSPISLFDPQEPAG
jgi:hypothetical protein